MAAVPQDHQHRLVHDPLSGDARGPSLGVQLATLRAEEDALLRQTFDGIAILAAGPANVAMQLAWPEVGYGVLESKVERGQVMKHPFKRFRTTVGYLGIALFGSPAQRLDFRRAVDTAHRQVRSGADSPVTYNAFNRDLQLWVASCLYYGARDVALRMHGPMTDAEEEVLLRAGARFGTTLQVPLDMWHRDLAAFWTYWEEGLARTRIDPPLRDYLLGGPGFWVNAGFVPEEIRRELGIAWTAADQSRHDRMFQAVGAVSRHLPQVVRRFPVNLMVLNLDVRRRLGRPLV